MYISPFEIIADAIRRILVAGDTYFLFLFKNDDYLHDYSKYNVKSSFKN